MPAAFLTDELAERIFANLCEGLPIGPAAAEEGLAPRTARSWREKGEKPALKSTTDASPRVASSRLRKARRSVFPRVAPLDRRRTKPGDAPRHPWAPLPEGLRQAP
jgi:hypothetical protein